MRTTWPYRPFSISPKNRRRESQILRLARLAHATRRFVLVRFLGQLRPESDVRYLTPLTCHQCFASLRTLLEYLHTCTKPLSWVCRPRTAAFPAGGSTTGLLVPNHPPSHVVACCSMALPSRTLQTYTCPSLTTLTAFLSKGFDFDNQGIMTVFCFYTRAIAPHPPSASIVLPGGVGSKLVQILFP